jgi:hypothetical protein
MKRSAQAAFSGLLIAMFATAAFAQLPPQAELKKKLEAKLAEPVFQQNDWITDYDQARAKAKDSGKPIFAYFSRSYSY